MFIFKKKSTKRTGYSNRNRMDHGIRFESLESRTLMSLLGVSPDFPLIHYNSGGTMGYNATSGAIDVNGHPVDFQLDATVEYAPVFNSGALNIDFNVNPATGAIVSGAPGHDLLLTGELDLDEDGFVDYSGDLLTAEILDFGFLNSAGSVADQFDFRFEVTGGSMASFYAGKDLVVTMTGENFLGQPGFTNFTQSFLVVAKGNLGSGVPAVQPASLGNFVWEDSNANGTFDLGEPGLDGVTVELLNSGGTVVATQTTSGGGAYLFTGLTPGDYSVRFIAPAAYFFSPDNVGDDVLDSDAGLGGLTDIYSLLSGASNLTVDAGLFRNASIGNFVWNDTNQNGVQDSGETGVEFATVELLDAGGNLISSQTTGVDGAYLFTGLAPTSYLIRFTPPTGFSFSPQDIGLDNLLDSDANITTGLTSLITLLSGESNLSVDAGVYTTIVPVHAEIDVEKFVRVTDGQIGGFEGLTPGFWKQPQHFDNWTTYVPNDNYNAIFGVNDDPSLTLLGALSRGGGENEALGRHAVAALLNSLNGGIKYSFTTAQIFTAVQNAYATGIFEPTKDTLAMQNELGADLTGGGSTPVFDPGNLGNDADSAPGLSVETGDNLLFNYTITAGMGDVGLINVVLIDDNGTPGNTADDFYPTPVLDSGFNLGDLDMDSVLDLGETWYYTANSTAGSAGQYSNLATANGSPEGGGADDVTDSDAAYWSVTTPPPAPASLSGFVYVDADNDGDIDNGEQAIVGATVSLFSGNTLVGTTTTNGDGQYAFTNLAAGTYKIVETQPIGFLDGKESLGTNGGILGADMFSGISIAAGEDGMNYNFGERLNQIGGAPVAAGQSATIGFWNNKNGQALIKGLNGSSTSTGLSTWLADNFPNMYGASAGTSSLAGKTNAQVAASFQTIFKVKSVVKLDAQVLAVAIACYATDSDLAGGTSASAYGFKVDTAGLGGATFNIGLNGAAFGVANNTTLSVLDILKRTNDASVGGKLWNGNTALRNLANVVFTGINEKGDIV